MRCGAPIQEQRAPSFKAPRLPRCPCRGDGEGEEVMWKCAGCGENYDGILRKCTCATSCLYDPETSDYKIKADIRTTAEMMKEDINDLADSDIARLFSEAARREQCHEAITWEFGTDLVNIVAVHGKRIAAKIHDACPNCGCEERGQGGYFSCQCPAKYEPNCSAILSSWMIEHSFVTGHGDSFDALLAELSRQVDELRAQKGSSIS